MGESREGILKSIEKNSNAVREKKTPTELLATPVRQHLLLWVLWKRLGLYMGLVLPPFFCGHMELKIWKSGRVHRAQRHPKRSSWPAQHSSLRTTIHRRLRTEEFVQWNSMLAIENVQQQ